MFRETDDSVKEAWEDSHMRLPLHGFSAESVVDVNLKRLFTSNILNFMYINIQGLLDLFLIDTNLREVAGYKDGVYLMRDSNPFGRRFNIIKKFRIYNQDTCRATCNYIKVTASVHEYPGPWIVAVKVDMCQMLGGVEVLVKSTNRD